MCAKLWTVGPQQYIPTAAVCCGLNSSTARDNVLNSFTDILRAEDSRIPERQKRMDEDLNVSAAWGNIFEWVRSTNKSLAENAVTAEEAASLLGAWERLDTVLGVGTKAATTEVPEELLKLLEERQAARKAKDFKRSDSIRDELKAKGWVIEDTPKGPKLKKI